MKRKYGSRYSTVRNTTELSVKRQCTDPLPSSTPDIPSEASYILPSTPPRPKSALEAWLIPQISSSIPPSSPESADQTPPSSPPPTSPIAESPQLFNIRKPAFSFLNRRPKSAPLPLTQSKNANKQLPNKNLTQMTLDLGGPATITCTECGMSYTPTQADDAALHAKHHARLLDILGISAVLWSSLSESAVWKSKDRNEYIIRITRKSKPQHKKLAERILSTAEQDLGSVVITSEQLWSGTDSHQCDGPRHKSDRYKVFLYLKDRKCLGLLLAEHISMAYRVLDQPVRQENLSLSDTTHPAQLGISRIWTSKTSRRSGVAVKLLEAASTNFLAFTRISKRHVAFSQPTTQGTALVRKWIGEESGWLVYLD